MRRYTRVQVLAPRHPRTRVAPQIVDIGQLPRAFTVTRIHAIEITLNWRWVPVLGLTTFLLAQNVLPARFPLWEMSTTWLTSFAVVLAGELALLLHELSHAFVA